MKLTKSLPDIAVLLGKMEQVVLSQKLILAQMELNAVDPESKSAVDKQVMIYAQKTPEYSEIKSKTDLQASKLSAYQRLYSLYLQIAQRIDFNIENNECYKDFEDKVETTLNEMSEPF